MAVAAVAVLAVTGACGRWELSSVSQIWTTSYGRTLLAKTLLL
jgi:putative copper export protein